MSQIGDIKNEVANILQELVIAGSLGEVQNDDGSKNIFAREFASFPAAIIGIPPVESVRENTADNIRQYTFEILFIQKSENVTTPTYFEDLIEAILDKFDENETLNGHAIPGDGPTTSAVVSVPTQGGGTFYVFSATIKARVSKAI